MQVSLYKTARKAAGAFNIEQLELKGFSRSLAELQWLLVALVILYYVAPKTPIERPHLFIGATVMYAFTVLAHRYSGLFQQETRWRLAAETWLMVLFITWLLWQTGNSESPLLNLYLLVLIMSGLTLGKTTTLLQLLLIAAIYVQTDYHALGEISFSTASLNELMTKFAPFVLTTYLVTLLAADIKFSRTALQDASETDELTGLPNRRAFEETMQREFERATRQARVFSILVIDADGLKPTNDAYGHAAGDRLIREIANSLKATLRASDHCARYGGDEFVALLADADANRALDAAERLRLCVANTSFDVGGNRVNATVSIGVATYPTDATDVEQLLSVADRALYQAKNDGKNRIRGFDVHGASMGDASAPSKSA
ncbi:MAG: GGDEF domain-containing protein [Gammaproteobacteria bacterium]|nr:GGDEF domain-containing protein [Gammaproteobacteria bacterium]